ncbi:Cytosolic 5'-nucleotidase 3A [Channa argus]|uniref:Cytosolic 5'-nucleotidase 3A n=1 Tax=Channa argus TaxID=215402 RepID=A0A6G1PQ61_CHAAH|nr:Cytosolic 5'-nucleotidase 3A [Channa argus]
MDRAAVVKLGAAASASVCALFGGVVLAQYIVAKKKRAGKKTRIIEMRSPSSLFSNRQWDGPVFEITKLLQRMLEMNSPRRTETRCISVSSGREQHRPANNCDLLSIAFASQNENSYQSGLTRRRSQSVETRRLM